jgi:(p)ppGpp synthase/HD superfamily hydrolase
MLTKAFDDALLLASELHRTQTRKGTGLAYLSHLLSVAALVLEDGGDEEEAMAALLHDAIEDQGDKISADEIERRFGRRVRELVVACTDTPEDHAGGEKSEWRTRKLAYLERVRRGTEPNRVSLADKVHNARSILRDHQTLGEAVWRRFSQDKERTLWYYRSLVAAYRTAGATGFLVDELDRVVTELEARSGRSAS